MIKYKTADKVRKFPDDILKIQKSLQDILTGIREWAEDEDYMQLRLLMPRFQYLLSMIEILKEEMTSALLEVKGNKDVLTEQGINSQMLALESIEGQIKSLDDSIKVSLKAIDASEKERLAADILTRCRELENASGELL